MADAITGLTQVDATIEEIVAAQVQEVLTASMVVPGSIMDYSAMVGPGMDKLKIPRFSNFVVSTKVSGTPVDAVTNAFSTDDLPLDKHQVIQWLLEDIAELQSKVAVAQAYVEQAAKDLAAKMDDDILTSMAASPSAAAPDHIVTFANSPTNTLSKADFTNARKLLQVQNCPMSDIFAMISPLREKDVLDISGFVDADSYGGTEGLRNGEIGRLFGFSVLISSQIGDDESLFYHKSTQAFARQLSPRVKTDDDLANLAMRYSVDHIWGTKALSLGKRIVKVNIAGA